MRVPIIFQSCILSTLRQYYMLVKVRSCCHGRIHHHEMFAMDDLTAHTACFISKVSWRKTGMYGRSIDGNNDGGSFLAI
jgi:hypothetical protein